MRVPARLFGSPEAMTAMEGGVLDQLRGVAGLPGLAGPVLAMPDAHTGYGFPIGGVAAFDAAQGGVVCAGGVGFDIACGVRALVANVYREEVSRCASVWPTGCSPGAAGLGSGGRPRLSDRDLDRMLVGGAAWAVAQGTAKRPTWTVSRIGHHGRRRSRSRVRAGPGARP
jgi:tRNA-splicing ligase RtcB